MRMIRVADYIADEVAKAGISQVFSVVGGGAMNLNDAFGHNPNLHVLYNHHEQACAIGAEGYARLNNKPACVVVTTGPGGTNAITGVVGAFVDSVPMIVISGQVRRDTFSPLTHLNLRAMGDQEFNIIPSVKNMTKYAEVIVDIHQVRYCVEKALFLATDGRMGPTWLDVPGDIQSAMFDPEQEEGFSGVKTSFNVSEKDYAFIVEKIKQSKRPVIYAGSAIRLSGGYSLFKKLISTLNIPVVTAWNSTDVIENDSKLYAGRAGNFGDRFGNFAVQNSDLILSLGCRLSIRQTGFDYKDWAKHAFVIMVDIDKDEMKKPNIHVDMPVQSDVKCFMAGLSTYLVENIYNVSHNEWIEQCKSWIKKYPVISAKQYQQKGVCNAYAVVDMLSKHLKENSIVVSGNGTACVVGGQSFITKSGTRFIENSGMASMGYDLPAAIGTCLANNKKEVICLTGDGSIQMNIQELETISYHKLPIKIIIINNNGYHSIRQSQSNFFKGETLCGIGNDSNDLGFPDMKRIAYAYDLPFYRINTNLGFARFLKSKFDSIKSPCIIEIMVDTKQYFQPKAGSKRLEDGKMVSMPLENLSPYLSEKEVEDNMVCEKGINEDDKR